MKSKINSLLSNTNPYTKHNSRVSKASHSVTSNSQSSNVYYTQEKAFIFQARGLRPSTQHFFYFGNTDVSSNCSLMVGNNINNSNSLLVGLNDLGSPLNTDETGSINFTFFYNSGINSNTNYGASQILANNNRGTTICTLKTLDGSSTATMKINIITGINNTDINFSSPVLQDATGESILSAPSSAFN